MQYACQSFKSTLPTIKMTHIFAAQALFQNTNEEQESNQNGVTCGVVAKTRKLNKVRMARKVLAHVHQ